MKFEVKRGDEVIGHLEVSDGNEEYFVWGDSKIVCPNFTLPNGDDVEFEIDIKPGQIKTRRNWWRLFPQRSDGSF